jgi:hypothetical protein
MNFTGGTGGTVYYTFSNSNTPGEYIFVGGVNAASVSTTNITFGSGVYVLAGSNTAGNPLFQTGTGTTLTDGGSSSGGELFVFSDGGTNGGIAGGGGYPGLSNLLTGNIPNFNAAIDQSLHFGQTGFTCPSCASGTDNSTISLNGLNASQMPAALSAYSNFLMWQDRYDTKVQYNTDGSIADTAGAGCFPEVNGGPVNLTNPCTNVNGDLSLNPSTANSPQQMNLDVNSRTRLNGTIYQPRGGWLQMNTTSGMTGGSLQIITGALSLSNSTGNGTGEVNLAGKNKLIEVPKNVLIE